MPQQEWEKAADDFTGQDEQVQEYDDFCHCKQQVDRIQGGDKACFGKQYGKEPFGFAVKGKIHQRVPACIADGTKRHKELYGLEAKDGAGQHNDQIEQWRAAVVIKVNMSIRIDCKAKQAGADKEQKGQCQCFFCFQESQSALIQTIAVTDGHIKTAGAPHLDVPGQIRTVCHGVNHTRCQQKGLQGKKQYPVWQHFLQQKKEKGHGEHTGKEPQTVILPSDLEEEITELESQRFLLRKGQNLRQQDIKAGKYQPGP